MTTISVPPETLREILVDVGAKVHRGETAGFVETELDLNLNALAIGLGLENVEYEPSRFPGLIYYLEHSEATVVLFDNGVIATVDTADERAARDAVSTVLKWGSELGLIEQTPGLSVTAGAESLPVAEQLADSRRVSTGSGQL